MNMQTIFKEGRGGFAVIALTLLLGPGSMTGLAASKPSAPAKSAPARPAPSRPAAAPRTAPSRPAGGAAGGASHGAPGGAATSHGPTANGAGHGTTAGAAGSHGTTANRPTANGPSAGAGSRTTASAGGGRPTTAGGRPEAGGRAGVAGSNNARPGAAGRGGPTPRGSHEVTARNGAQVRTRGNGRVADVHDSRRGMDIHHGLDGGRRVSVQRHDGSRLVAERGRRGYVQRGYAYHGHDYARRSYYYHGHAYERYYRGYGYRGLSLNVYAPGYYYGPGFYGWAYNPWAVPIAYGWGWGGSPWFGFYGGYFTPYPVYPSASFWLTDYIISQDLQAAYAARQEAGAAEAAAAGAPTPLTPEVKQMIADEVKNQLALENAEAAQTNQQQEVDPASSGIARLLGDGRPHMFVVGDGLDVVEASTEQECHVSEGDALQLVTPPAADATVVNLTVKASKGGVECAPGSSVAVNLTDLQEMQNHMRENIDLGLKELQAKQGKGGLPQAPPSAQAPPKETQFAAIAPPENPQDAADIQAQSQQADQAETEATAGGGGN